MSQTLAKFQSVFSTDAVRIEFDDFTKDGAFSADIIDGLKDAGLDAVYLKPLTSAARADLESSVAGLDGKRDTHNLYARFVAPCWCEPDGKPVGKATEIGKLRADLVAALFKKVRELNGMDDDAVDEAGKD